MAHRQEEKERRRRERLEREAAEARAKARRTRLQWVGGGILGVALIAGLVVALVAGLGGGDEGEARRADASAEQVAQLPPQQIADLTDAAEAAGCELVNARLEGNGHDTREFAASDYRTNPPTSGDHNPEWYDDGIYEADAIPRLGMVVHTLEHGRINVQYRPNTPQASVDQLEALLAESNEGYHMLLYPNTTGMEHAVSATAWTHSLNCERMNDRVFDAIRAFRTRWIDRGPEQVP